MKQKLLDSMRIAKSKEESDLWPHVDDLPPETPGRWTAKDQLAHLTAWRVIAASELDLVRTAGAGHTGPRDFDAENARIYQEKHEQAAALIRDTAINSWEQVARSVEACSDEVLAKPRSRRPEEQLWQDICIIYHHLMEHLVYWQLDRGDDAAAEDAARWGYELAESMFPADSQRGVAAYNVGCIYALRGRADAAIPHLRAGLRLRPDIRDWAKRDPDLDPIRSTRALRKLLGDEPANP
jgi:tetratricopeptide (TPR) repeat protein